MLGPDVGVAQLQRLAQAQLEDLLRPRGEGGRAGTRVRVRADGLLDLLAHHVEGHAEGVEGLGGHPFALADETEQDVLGPAEGVVQVARLFLGQDEDSTGPVCESFEQLKSFYVLVSAVYRGAGRPHSLLKRVVMLSSKVVG